MSLSSTFAKLVPASLLVALFLAAGCARLPVAAPLPPWFTVTSIAAVEPTAPFACNPEEEGIAYGREGLRLEAADGGEEHVLADDEPFLLSWSPDGGRLAAAFTGEGGTVLRLFAANGMSLGETLVPGNVGALGWNASELMAAAVTLETFSFGGTLRQLLYRWDGIAAPKAITLSSTTLMRSTVKQWGGALPGFFHLAVSPWGDAIVYTRFHDPPAFSPYLKVILRHLESGEEQELASVSLDAGGALFTPFGEAVLYGDGRGASSLIDPWAGGERPAHSLPGRALAFSPGATSLFIDGHLYREDKELAVFTAASAGCFTRHGRELVVRSDGHLFRVAGLPPDETLAPEPQTRQRLLELRKWRSEGLITAEEYRRTAGKEGGK
ncbi:MAG TPA: hypothetical protein VI389_05395 [Geobacteraceae bacterium]